jgi:septal ring factor EnvC (AmiA/AmiB activator)
MPHRIKAIFSGGLHLFNAVKDFLFQDRVKTKLNDVANDVGSLQEKIRDHRQDIDQVKTDIEKHKKDLNNLREEAQQTGTEVAKLRIVSYWAIGLAGLSVLLAVLVWVFK